VVVECCSGGLVITSLDTDHVAEVTERSPALLLLVCPVCLAQVQVWYVLLRHLNRKEEFQFLIRQNAVIVTPEIVGKSS
jgi:hypothetical protein